MSAAKDLSLDVGDPVDVLLPEGRGGAPPYTYALTCSPALAGRVSSSPPARGGSRAGPSPPTPVCAATP